MDCSLAEIDGSYHLTHVKASGHGVGQICAMNTECKPLLLDTRPIFAGGEAPCKAIDEAVEHLNPGQPLVLLVPFEPVPLYIKYAKQGFTHEARELSDGTWRVEFRKAN